VPIGLYPEARMRSVRWFGFALLAVSLLPSIAWAAPRFDTRFFLLDHANSGWRDASIGRQDAPATAIGDLNGDGRADVVIGERLYWDVARLWLSNGDGSFQPRNLVSPFPELRRIALGDLDGDGRLDLVSAGGPLYVHRGLGNGEFAPPSSYAYSDVRFIRLVDFDLDGRLDVLTSDGYYARLRTTKADGSLDSATWQYTDSPLDLQMANVRGDAHPEVLGTNGLELAVRSWDPFGDSPQSRVGPAGTSIAVGDFDQDGWQDVATGSWLYRGSVGGLVPAGTIALEAKSVADVDGDGHLDLLGNRSRALAIARGHGDGSFDAPVEYPSGESTDWIEPGDFDGDGKADVLVRRASSGQSILYLDVSRPGADRLHAFPTGAPARQVLAHEVTGDGHVDALVVASDGLLSWLAGDGMGGLGAPHAVAMPSPVSQIVLEDLDGDGRKDLVAIATSTPRAYIRLAAPTGEGFLPAMTYELWSQPSWVGCADFDGDARDEVVIANVHGERAVLHNRGDGTFDLPPAQENDNFTSVYHRFCLGDLNGDGHVDFVGAEHSGAFPNFYTWYGNAQGGLNSWSSFYWGLGYRAPILVIRDINGTSPAEFVCAAEAVEASFGPATYRTYLSMAEGWVATSPTDFTGGEGLSAFHVADLDGDGHLEYVIAGSRVNALTVWTSDDSGSPIARRDVAVDNGPVSIASADFNEDGRLDLVVVHSDAPTAVVLLDAATEPAPRLAQPAVPRVDASGVSIEWSAPASRDSWARVARRNDLGEQTVSEPTRLDAEGRWAYHDGAVIPGRLYTYRLIADTQDGPCVTGYARAKVPMGGISPLPLSDPIERHIAITNPVRGSTLAFGLDGFAAAPVDVTLHSVTGRVVGRWILNGGANVQLARPSGLAPGVYLVRTTQGDQVVSGRVVLL
jgi:hypothetical protein